MRRGTEQGTDNVCFHFHVVCLVCPKQMLGKERYLSTNISSEYSSRAELGRNTSSQGCRKHRTESVKKKNPSKWRVWTLFKLKVQLGSPSETKPVATGLMDQHWSPRNAVSRSLHYCKSNIDNIYSLQTTDWAPRRGRTCGLSKPDRSNSAAESMWRFRTPHCRTGHLQGPRTAAVMGAAYRLINTPCPAPKFSTTSPEWMQSYNEAREVGRGPPQLR